MIRGHRVNERKVCIVGRLFAMQIAGQVLGEIAIRYRAQFAVAGPTGLRLEECGCGARTRRVSETDGDFLLL